MCHLLERLGPRGVFGLHDGQNIGWGKSRSTQFILTVQLHTTATIYFSIQILKWQIRLIPVLIFCSSISVPFFFTCRNLLIHFRVIYSMLSFPWPFFSKILTLYFRLHVRKVVASYGQGGVKVGLWLFIGKIKQSIIIKA